LLKNGGLVESARGKEIYFKNQHLDKSGKENSLKDVKKTFAGTVTTVGLQPVLGLNFTGQGQQEGGQPF
jgi:hypothetical protein